MSGVPISMRKQLKNKVISDQEAVIYRTPRIRFVLSSSEEVCITNSLQVIVRDLIVYMQIAQREGTCKFFGFEHQELS